MKREIPLLRRRGLLRTHAPTVFLIGLVLFGVSVLLLALLAQDVRSDPVTDPIVRVENGTATQTYFAVLGETGVVRGTYSFPKDPGTVYTLDCLDYGRYVAGQPLQHSPLVMRNVMNGSIQLDSHEIFSRFYNASQAPPVTGGPNGTAPPMDLRDLRRASPYCPAAYVVFEWSTGNASWQDNAPAVSLVMRTYPLDTDAGGFLMALSVVSAILALTGGLSWGSQRGLDGYAPLTLSAADDESTAETLHRLAENTGHWLERTRRYLLLSGVLGIFLWYPILVPWAYKAGRDASLDESSGLVLAAAVLVFLLVVTFIWGRTFLQLDRELAQWRDRMARLQKREQELLDSLERDG